jgi:hypothetical protein
MLEGSGAGSVLVTNGPDADPGGPKNTDPDPDADSEHWYIILQKQKVIKK